MPEHDICAIYRHNMLELKKIPAEYHCWKHTKYGFDVLPFIARYEGVSDEDFFNLRVAYLYHERGMKFGRREHEKAWHSTFVGRVAGIWIRIQRNRAD